LIYKNKSTRYRGSAKAVGSFLPDVTRKVFQKFGFPAAALLTDWEAIVGPQMASFTHPERLKWPKTSPDEAAGTNRGNQETGATLLLRVDGPLAIELQHQSDQILERINGYFGYRAVATLRVLQAPLSEIRIDAHTRPKPMPREILSKCRQEELSSVLDPALRDALAGLARRVTPAAASR